MPAMSEHQLPLNEHAPISPWLEMGAYEALWAERGASFKSIAQRFKRAPGAVPSDFIENSVALEYAARAHDRIRRFTVLPYGVRVHGAGEYPKKVRDARHPIELLYYQGIWALSESRAVALVGTRDPSEDGAKRARQLVNALSELEITVVSGLARGIDTVVHQTALERGSKTMAVIGTPISMAYPSENAELQHKIAREHLLISQVPVVSYSSMPLHKTRTFFPERNVTMSALTEATIIVEAGETSGTLTQAQAAIEQGRTLFILESCFKKPNLSWPARFEAQGAVRVRKVDDIIDRLGTPNQNRSSPSE